MKNITIFTDGSSRGNPGRGGYAAVVSYQKLVNSRKQDYVTEIGGRENNTTNNRMELTAVIESLNFVSKLTTNNSLLITLYTDSSYVLKGAKEWVHGWQKNNWKTKTKQAVLNQDLWEKYLKVSAGLKIDWHLLKGHSGIPANERCDEIATAFADGKFPKLHTTILQNYGIDLSVSSDPTAKSLKLKARSSSKPYSYVSMVKGVVKTHKTWTECEKRVKGVSGAKFKKSFSPEDEKQIINSWSR